MRTVGRTAVIAGTATTVSNRVSRRQAGRWADQDAQEQAQAPAAAPEPAAAPAEASASAGTDRLEQLKQLGDLKASRVLTDEEFESEKAKILAG